MKIYYIYEITDVKIGCTDNLERRKQELKGKGTLKILEEHTDIYKASEREISLQKLYGYKVDKNPYWYVVQIQVPKAHKPDVLAKVAKATVKRQKGKPIPHLHNSEVYKKRGKTLSNTMKGSISSNLLESCQKRKKKVFQYTKSGKLIKQYNSLTEAVKLNNSRSITHCVAGRTKSALGYLWTY